MVLVLDASLTVTWAFPDEDDPLADEALERVRIAGAFAPALWWFEVSNTLVVGERRKRISESQTSAFLNELALFNITVDHSPNEANILTLARRHKLTVYDAAYLELALRRGVPLATFDDALRRACKAAGGTLL